MQRDSAYWTAAILNAAWHVRANERSHERHAQAVQQLGALVRDAFQETDDFRPLLRAVAEGLSQAKDNRFAL